MSATFGGLNGASLRIPMISTKIRGHTGIDKALISSHDNDHSIEDVINVMKGLPKTEYILNYWDCEDRAFYAISRARCKYPCMPMGIAVGEAADQGIVAGKHALVILWDKGFSRAVYYDPEKRDTLDFNAEVIIPMPCQGNRRGDGIPNTGGLPFLDRGGAFVLDAEYDFSAEKLAAAKAFLIGGGLEECEEGETKCPKFRDNYHNYDRVFSWFINFRKEESLRGVPIGIAFGRWKDAIDQAALLFWENAAERPSYWTVTAGRIPKDQEGNFKPSIILV